MTSTRVILIDPHSREVRHILLSPEQDANIGEMVLGCARLDVVSLKNDDYLVIDDECLICNQSEQEYFRIEDKSGTKLVIGGLALIIGIGSNGRTRSPRSTVPGAFGAIEWLARADGVAYAAQFS